MKLHRVFGAPLIAFVVAIATLSATVARATSFSTDQSDVWSVAGEPGWAIQFVQRGSAIFATMYVYGPSNQPTFYSATLEATATLTWSGDLIATTGPWFGTVPFNPALVTIRKVGTMTWNATSVSTGTLTYSADGVVVVKFLVRFLARYDDYNGTYIDTVHTDLTGCFNSASNGPREAVVALGVVQSGLSVNIALADTSGTTCTFTGSLSQAGQFGQVTGTWTCSDGSSGAFQFFEMNVGVNYLTGRLSTTNSVAGCNATGYFAAMRHRP